MFTPTGLGYIYHYTRPLFFQPSHLSGMPVYREIYKWVATRMDTSIKYKADD